MYQEYTLKKHLNNLCNENPQYKDLENILFIEEKELKRTLGMVIYNYPHYSLHDNSHSETILNNIELFMGEENIKKLQPTETWLLIMAAYYHDIGMNIPYEMVEKELFNEKFEEFLDESIKKEIDEESKENKIQIKKIIHCLRTNKKYENYSMDLLLKMKKTLTLLISEYFRKNHAQMSSDFIATNKFKGMNLINSIKPRLLSLLKIIVKSHQKNFDYIEKKLPYKCNGVSKDIVYPRMIASLLRIGDLLDLDNSRFNENLEIVFGKLPKVSEIHNSKHESITSYYISPSLIEIEANCINQNVYLELRNWLKWLEEEIKNITYKWFEIMPEEFSVIIPKLKMDKIQINNKVINNEYLDLNLNFDTEKIYEILEGGNIYASKFIFVRELLQNSIDASKLKFWKDIKNSFSKEEINDIKNSPIKYLLEKKLEKYPIKIKLYTEDVNNNDFNIVFEIEDKGIGISIDDIKKIKNIGVNHNLDIEKKLTEELPFYLKPTKAFGLGLQSCFLMTDQIFIDTKNYGESGKKIKILTGKKNGFISIEESDKIETGTIIKLNISKEKIRKELSEINYMNIVNMKQYYLCEVYNQVYKEIVGKDFFEVEKIEEKKKSKIWNLYGFPIEIKCEEVLLIEKIETEKIETEKIEIKKIEKEIYDAVIMENKILVIDKLNERFYEISLNINDELERTQIFYKNIKILSKYNLDFKISNFSYSLYGLSLKVNIFGEEADKFLTIDRNNILDKKSVDERKKITEFKNRILKSLIEKVCEIKDNNMKIKDDFDIEEENIMNDYEYFFTYNYNMISESNKKICKLKSKYKKFLNSQSFKNIIYYGSNELKKETIFFLDKIKKKKPSIIIKLMRKINLIEEVIHSMKSNDKKNITFFNGQKESEYLEKIYKMKPEYSKDFDIIEYKEKRSEKSATKFEELVNVTFEYLIEPSKKFLGIRRSYILKEEFFEKNDEFKLYIDKKFLLPFYYLNENKRNDEEIYAKYFESKETNLIKNNINTYITEEIIRELSEKSKLYKEEIIEEYTKFIEAVYEKLKKNEKQKKE